MTEQPRMTLATSRYANHSIATSGVIAISAPTAAPQAVPAPSPRRGDWLQFRIVAPTAYTIKAQTEADALQWFTDEAVLGLLEVSLMEWGQRVVLPDDNAPRIWLTPVGYQLLAELVQEYRDRAAGVAWLFGGASDEPA